eukprot:gene899-980_t
MAVPKVQLNLDDLALDTSHNDGLVSPGRRSLASESVADNVETEKCVVSQYRTSLQQKQAFQRLLSNCSRDAIPVEWVIDIADESNGWFYATAYHYNDNTQMLHVMVPDKENPTFDGYVQLDHRTVHLIECVDGNSLALFNKIVRDGIIKIKWELEWYEEPEGGTAGVNSNKGVWISSFARYYIRMANQLLVEDQEVGQEGRGFVIITADLTVRLLACMKGKGEEDFSRLINEGIVQSTPAAAEYAANVQQASAKKASRGSEDLASETSGSGSFSLLKKLSEMAKGLRECVEDMADERSRRKEAEAQRAEAFRSFALDGDLDSGLTLLDDCEHTLEKQHRPVEEGDPEERIANTVEDAVYLSHKVERGLHKVVSKTGGATGEEEDVEQLKETIKKLKKELEKKNRGQY